MKNNKIALAAALVAGGLASPAHAQTFYGFGDSLVDNGNIPKLTGLDQPPPPYYENRFSNGPVWAEYFPGLAGFNFVPSDDYAVGGAFSGPLTVLGTTYNNLANLEYTLGVSGGLAAPLPNFLQEVQTFQASGTRLDNRDIVGLWIGANDYFATLNLVNAGVENAATALPAIVQTVTQQTSQGVAELTAMGARRFVVFNLPDLGVTPSYNASSAAQISLADSVSQAHDAALAASMNAAHEATGANIIVINTAKLFNDVIADPAAFGKTNTTDACIDVASCVNAPTAVQNQYLFWDTVHPTTGSHQIIAEYTAEAVNGLAGLAVPAQVAALGSTSFMTQLSQREEALRAGAPGFSVNVPGQGMAGQIGGDSKLSGFFSGSYDYGSLNTIGADNGFNYNIGTFAFGLDNQVAPGIAVGAAVGYSTEHGNVEQDGTVSANAYQFGLYADFYRPHYYLAVNAAYGIDDFNTRRSGLLNVTITGKPSGNTASLGGEAGYILDAGPVVFGPVAGLNINYANLGSYTENGFPGPTQSVQEQSFTQFTGDIGMTASGNFTLGALVVHPFVTATLDKLFSGNGGSFDSTFTDEPAVTLTTTYPSTTTTWGEISGGLSAAVTDRISLSGNFATTFAKSDGANRAVNAALHISF